MKKKITNLVWTIIPDRLLEDSKGYPTDFCWKVHAILVKLKLTPKLNISKGSWRFMWGDKDITDKIEEIDLNG